MSPSVQLMLQRIVDGDSEARGWLFDTFAERLLRRIRLRYGELDAEEILQESFVAYLRNDADLLARARQRIPTAEQTEARLERFLWDQACGIATNHRRSAVRRSVLSFEADPDARRNREPSPERVSLHRDQLERLDRCLRTAGSRVYLYYKLRYYDGLTPDEISKMTGWSKKATYKLKQKLNEAVSACAESLRLG